jgi:ATP-dependent RNA helicase SUPV3L1/SUV3
MGDNLHVHRYERLNPLKVMSKSLRGNFKNLRKGDCVVTFTVVNIHALKKQIERETGKRVAIVYGSLPPETRAQQAAFFNDPDNDYDFLVASDAIGMGLNLSIKRVIFESVTKFNGVTREQLSVPQLKQIGGRAGRYRTSHDDMNKGVGARTPTPQGPDSSSIGLVTTVDERDLPVVQNAFRMEAPPIRTAGLLPPGDFVTAYASRLPAGVSHEYVMQRICDVSAMHPRFNLCTTKDQVSIARLIQKIPGLSTPDRCLITAAPADYKSLVGQSAVRALARAIGNKKQITVVDLSEIPLEVLEKPLIPDRFYLGELEGLHKALVLYLWLGYRFPTVLRDLDMAFHAKAMTEQRISAYLQTFSANRHLQRRLEEVKQRNMQLAQGGEERTQQESGTLVDFSEGDVSEDFHEGDSAEVEAGAETVANSDATALPIDWSRGAEDAAEMSNEDDVPSKGQAASANR